MVRFLLLPTIRFTCDPGHGGLILPPVGAKSSLPD